MPHGGGEMSLNEQYSRGFTFLKCLIQPFVEGVWVGLCLIQPFVEGVWVGLVSFSRSWRECG